MKIQYYGTGAAEGIPALFCICDVCKHARETGGRNIRTRSGAMIDGELKLDFPPDTYHHLLVNGVDITYLRYLLITHPHEDHYAFAELLYRMPGFAQLSDDIPPLTVYGGKEVGEKLRERLSERREAPNVLFEHFSPFEQKQIGSYAVTALPSRHMVQAESYIYLIERDGKKILYAHDSGVLYDEVYDFLAGKAIDLVSLDCTYMTRDTTGETENGHMGLPVNRAVRERLIAIGAANASTQFIVNHFSHNGGKTHQQLVDAADGFTVSYDGMAAEAGRR